MSRSGSRSASLAYRQFDAQAKALEESVMPADLLAAGDDYNGAATWRQRYRCAQLV
jgi:hypothetical protein